MKLQWKMLLAALIVCLSFASLAARTAFAETARLSFVADAPLPVVIPWGAWLAQGLGWSEQMIVVLVGGLVSAYGPPMAKLFISDAALKRAVDFAIANVEGATAGKVMTIEISNAVAQRALNYLVEQEPRIADWLGDTLGPRVLSALQNRAFLPPDSLTPPRLAPV